MGLNKPGWFKKSFQSFIDRSGLNAMRTSVSKLLQVQQLLAWVLQQIELPGRPAQDLDKEKLEGGHSDLTRTPDELSLGEQLKWLPNIH